MNEIKSKVIAGQWMPSYTGRLIPLVKVRRVTLNSGNVNVRLCTLGGLANLKRLDVNTGDTIIIRRGQPFNLVVGVDKSQRPEYAHKIAIPTHCPSCSRELVTLSDGELYCVNNNCVGVNMARLKRFCFHDGLNLDCLSDYRMRIICERHYLKRPSDLLKVDRLNGWLTTIPSTDEQHVEMLTLLIDSAKSKPLYNILYALGIGELKLSQCKTLAEKYDIRQLAVLSLDEYMANGLTHKQAMAITHYFMCDDWKHDLNNMRDFDVFKSYSDELK